MKSCNTEIGVLILKHEDCDTPRVHAKDNAFLNKTAPQVFLRFDEISSERSLPQAEQSQLSQPVLREEMAQAF